MKNRRTRDIKVHTVSTNAGWEVIVVGKDVGKVVIIFFLNSLEFFS